MQHLHISYFLWYQFPTVHHNMILIGYNKTCLIRHKKEGTQVWNESILCVEKYGYLYKSKVYMAYTLHMWNRLQDSQRSTDVCVCVCGIQVPGLLVIYRHPLPQVVCTIMPNRKMRKHISKKLRMHHTCSKIGRETVYEKTSSRP